MKHPRLRDCDLEARHLGEEEYRRELRARQQTMQHLQQAYVLQKRRAIIVLEGWDAAGKGSTIRHLTEGLDPRAIRVWPIAAPTAREQGIHYLYRFWEKMPAPGTIVVFDRSWYGRVLVERVEQLIDKPAWRRAYDEINDFERLMTADGVPVLKFFLHVSPEEQAKRLRERIEKPWKRWKITIDDFHNRERRPAYTVAIDDMLKQTHTRAAPWHVIGSNYKWKARTEVLRVVTAMLGRGVDLRPPEVPAAIKRAAKGL